MANSEVVLDVEYLREKTQRKFETTATAKSATKDGGDAKPIRKWPSVNTIFNPKGNFLPIWYNVLVISCVVALLVDPLFLYIPITNRDMKCLGLDQTLKIVTLFLRSAVDLPCIVHIISRTLAARSQVSRLWWRRRRSRRLGGKAKLVEYAALDIDKRNSWPKYQVITMNQVYILLIDILAILPIPQVVILIFLTRTRGSKSLNARNFLNFLVIFQYVPRAFRMYLSCKEANKTSDNWNGYTLFLKVYKFILASHVLGALWYYLSIQREMDCWQYAYRNENRREAITFDCGGNHTFKNATFLNDLCPINIPNPTIFNFGIFLDALQSDIMGSTDFPHKFLQCFWWGLRSLSSFGQNLQTSTYAWENLFALCISIAGMLLFLIYLNAILQFAITRRSEKLLRQQRRSQEIDIWLSTKGIPEYVKEVIMATVQQKLEENIDVGVDNILSVLPPAQSNFIARHLRLAMLKKVPMLQVIDTKLLKAIDEYLLPVSYTEDSCIVREGEPLDMLFIITHGTVQTYMTNVKGGKFGSKLLETGDSYGSELLYWASNFMLLDELPISTRTVEPVTRTTEALALKASHLEMVCTKFWWHFTKDKQLHQFSDNQLHKLQEFAASALQKAFRRRKKAKRKPAIIRSLGYLDTLKKIPMLQTLGVKPLRAIGEYLKTVDYTEDGCIFQEGDRLDKMIFITHGTVQTYKTNGKGVKIGSMFLEKGDFYGADELITWASYFRFFEDLPISMRRVKPITKVEVFELSADDLKSVAIKYWWHFTRNKDLNDFNYSLLTEFAQASIEKEIRRRKEIKQAKKIKPLNKRKKKRSLLTNLATFARLNSI